MSKLRHRAIQQALEFLRELYVLRSWDDLTTHVVHAIPALIPTSICSYNEINSRRQRAVYKMWPPDRSMIPDAPEILAKYSFQHPVVTHIERTKDLSTRKITDFVTQRQFRTTALFNELYRPLKIPYCMGNGLALNNDCVVGIGLNRDGKDFTAEELAVMELLRPHLVQAYGNAERVTAMQNELSVFNRVLEETDRAVLALTPQNRIQWATPRAYHLLTAYGLTRRRQADWLPTPLLNWIRHTTAQLDTPSDFPPPLEPLEISRDGHSLTIRLIKDRSNRLLLLNERRATPALDTLNQLGLSRRETEILSWVVQGKTNPEIATILGISPRTVQKHLERVYGRLGVENRHAAMRVVMEARREG